MSPPAIFVIGIFTTALLAIFVYETIHLLRQAGEAPAGTAGAAPATAAAVVIPSGPMRVLVAVDGSPCSDVAVKEVAARPWPIGTDIEIITVVPARTLMPSVDNPPSDTTLLDQARELDQQRARSWLERAQQDLERADGITVQGSVVEGDPAAVIVAEADRWKASLVVVGSHGYGAVKRVILGSVSQYVATHAPCSVEIARCDAPRDVT